MSGAVVVVHQNRLMRQFREAKATAPKSASTLTDIGCRNSWVFRRMVARGVFIETNDGRFYMDEDVGTSICETPMAANAHIPCHSDPSACGLADVQLVMRVHSRVNDRHQPLFLIFDSETMPEWCEMPATRTCLPRSASSTYGRGR